MEHLENKQIQDVSQQGSGLSGLFRIVAWVAGAMVLVVVLVWLSRLGVLAVSFFTLNEQVGEVRGLPKGVAGTISLLLSVLFVTLGGTALYYLVTGFRLGNALLALAALAALQFMIHNGVDLLAQPRQISLESLANRPLFDRKGNSLVFYAKGSKCPDIFDAPGFHPQTRDQLLPITAEIAQAIQSCVSARRHAKQEEEALAVRKQKEQQDRLQRAEAEKRTEELAVEAARQAVARVGEASRALDRALALESQPVTFKLVNEDCKTHDLYLSGSFHGRVSPNGGMIEIQIIPGHYVGKVCAPHDPNICSSSRDEELTPGSVVTRKIRRNPRCIGSV